MNDTYQEYDNCRIQLAIADDSGARLHEQDIDVACVKPDSSESITNIRWGIAGQVEGPFHVSLSLRDSAGKELSYNQYQLLIGNQALARKRMQAMGQERSARNQAFTSANYYRFFPDMIQQNDRDWQSQAQTPRANSFPQREKTPPEHRK